MILSQLSERVGSALLRWIDVPRALPIQFDITNRCNLRCAHCYHPDHSNVGAASLTDWLAIMDQYEQLCAKFGYSRTLILCGGEPALSPHIKPILERVASYEVPYSLVILTNGTLPERYPHAMLERFENVTFQVSLDGPDATRHDPVRGTGTFDRSMAGLSRLRSFGYTVEILAVLSLRNVGWITDFFELAISVEANFLSFTRLVPRGAALELMTSGKDRPLEKLELRTAFEAILSESVRTGIRTNTRSPLMNLVHPSLGAKRRSGECIVVDYKGRMLASSRSGIVLGDVLKEGMENLHFSHPLKTRLRQGDIKSCSDCPHFSYCGGDRNAAFAATGDYFGADPGCWAQDLKQTETIQ